MGLKSCKFVLVGSFLFVWVMILFTILPHIDNKSQIASSKLRVRVKSIFPNLSDDGQGKTFDVKQSGIVELQLENPRNTTSSTPHPLSQKERYQLDPQKFNRGIPRIIHQSWKSTEKIPEKFSRWMQSWTSFHPTWQYMFWDDIDNLHLFQKKFPKYYAVALAVTKIQLADMARYALLFHYGGVYADSDFECLASFDDLVQNEIILSYEPFVHSVLLEGATKPVLCNAILASKPGHSFWLRLLDNIKAKFETSKERDPVSLTGPRMVESTVNALQNSAYNITILPEEYFYPEFASWNSENLYKKCGHVNTNKAIQDACKWLQENPNGRRTKNTHAVHHWQCTWCRGDDTKSYVPLSKIFPDKEITRPQF